MKPSPVVAAEIHSRRYNSSVEELSGELVGRLWEALNALSEDASRRQNEAWFEEWKARGEDPDAFDWCHIDVHEIDSDEARVITQMWGWFHSLYALLPPSTEIKHIEANLTEISVPYLQKHARFVTDEVFPRRSPS